MHNSNPEITVGSLYDDYDGLKTMLEENIPTFLDLERFAQLLIAISYELSS